MDLLLTMYGILDAFMCLIAIPMIMEWIPPNGLYGFRVRATLNDPELWYRVNKFTGKLLLLLGIVIFLSAVALRWLPGMNEDVYGLAMAAVVLGGLGVVVTAGLRMIWRSKKRTSSTDHEEDDQYHR